MHHPWRRFAELSDWRLRWAELPSGVMGLTCHRTRTVTLALGMTQAERRCTIAHETQHILRGPVAAHRVPAEEREVELRVASLLVPDVRRVADALVRCRGGLPRAADELWVDDVVLAARLEHLTAQERDYLDRRLADAGV